MASASPAPKAVTTGQVAVPDHHHGVLPTVVLVHGAFADASGFSGVITRLQDRGSTVIAPANPLRGVATDSAYSKDSGHDHRADHPRRPLLRR